jgi:hypothetical protein
MGRLVTWCAIQYDVSPHPWTLQHRTTSQVCEPTLMCGRAGIVPFWIHRRVKHLEPVPLSTSQPVRMTYHNFASLEDDGVVYRVLRAPEYKLEGDSGKS